MPEFCVLEGDNRLCVECGRCNLCDLNPDKICDNCMRCLKRSGADYAEIEISAVYAPESPTDGK
jgi:hypothetical protein